MRKLASYAASPLIALVMVLTALSGSASASTDGSLPCSPPTLDNMTYRGGFVLHQPQVVLVFWGPNWSPSNPVVTELQHLFSGLTGSSWARTITQYCDSSGGGPQIAGFDSSISLTLLAGTYFDPSQPPSSPDDQAMADEAWMATRAVPAVFGGVPIIVTPSGVTPTGDAGRCGHHGWAYVADRAEDFQFASVPEGVIAASPNLCQPHGSVLDGVSEIAGHEWAETATDPFVNDNSNPEPMYQSAWAATVTAPCSAGQTTCGLEVADLCEPDQADLSGKSIDTFWLKLPTGRFWMQQLWSNEAGPSTLQGKCVKGS